MKKEISIEIGRNKITEAIRYIRNPYLTEKIIVSVFDRDHDEELNQILAMNKALGKIMKCCKTDEEIPFLGDLQVREAERKLHRPLLTLNWFLDTEKTFFWYMYSENDSETTVTNVDFQYAQLEGMLPFRMLVGKHALDNGRTSGKVTGPADAKEYVKNLKLPITVMLNGNVVEEKVLNFFKEDTWE